MASPACRRSQARPPRDVILRRGALPSGRSLSIGVFTGVSRRMPHIMGQETGAKAWGSTERHARAGTRGSRRLPRQARTAPTCVNGRDPTAGRTPRPGCPGANQPWDAVRRLTPMPAVVQGRPCAGAFWAVPRGRMRPFLPRQTGTGGMEPVETIPGLGPSRLRCHLKLAMLHAQHPRRILAEAEIVRHRCNRHLCHPPDRHDEQAR